MEELAAGWERGHPARTCTGARLCPYCSLPHSLKGSILSWRRLLDSTYCTDTAMSMECWSAPLDEYTCIKVLPGGVDGGVPVPLKDTSCEPLPAVSVTQRDPVSAPTCSGVNVTLIVQLAPTPRLELQVFVSVKAWPALMEIHIKVPVPVLVSVTVCAGLVVNIFWGAKVRVEGERLAMGVCCAPVPLRFRFCGLSLASSKITSTAVRAPPPMV